MSEVIELFSKTEEKIKSVNQLRLSRRNVKNKIKKSSRAGEPEGDGVSKQETVHGEVNPTC